MGHARSLVQSQRSRCRRARHHHHSRPPCQSRLSHLLARPRLRPFRRQPARPENFQRGQARVEFLSSPPAPERIPPPPTEQTTKKPPASAANRAALPIKTSTPS